MRSRLAALLLSLLALAAPAAAQENPLAIGEEHCVVNIPTTDTLNLRAGPGTGHPVLASLRYAQCGVILTDDCQGNWCPVENGHHAGWVHRRYLSMVSPARYCVTGVEGWDVLNLRAFPAATSRILTELAPNACGISFLPYRTTGWQKVRADGFEGWVAARFLTGQ
jgi:uncharacterized protein YgiM (DUF1202 family)